MSKDTRRINVIFPAQLLEELDSIVPAGKRSDVIANAVYLLRMVQSDANGQVQECLDIMDREVAAATKIVTDLLDFGRTREPIREEVAVLTLAESVLARRPPPEDVDVCMGFPADLSPVHVDPQQIEIALGNLVTNALQAMPGGGTLTIGAVVTPGGVALSVSDTGCGISEEVLSKLFEPLFTTKTRGMGLGLPTTRTLVKANGGTIEAQSEAGHGAKFTIILLCPDDREE